MNEAPIILMDMPDDGYCESLGWVQATVTIDKARDMLAEFCCDENGDSGARPAGEPKRVTLRLINPDEHYEDQRWKSCEPGQAGATEFFQFDATDVDPAPAVSRKQASDG